LCERRIRPASRSCQAPFTAAEWQDVRRAVFGLTVTGIKEYSAELRAVGFAEVEAVDLMPDWAPYAAERLAAWRANRESYARICGEGAYVPQEHFCIVISRLYEGDHLGGVCLTARVM